MMTLLKMVISCAVSLSLFFLIIALATTMRPLDFIYLCTAVGMLVCAVIILSGILLFRRMRRKKRTLSEQEQHRLQHPSDNPQRNWSYTPGEQHHASVIMGVAIIVIIVGCFGLLLVGTCGASFARSESGGIKW